MTTTEILELAAERLGEHPKLVWGFVLSFLETLIEELDRGNEVKVRGLGTFKWVDVPAREVPEPGKMLTMVCVPAGRKLKFLPSKRFQTRRVEQCQTKTKE